MQRSSVLYFRQLIITLFCLFLNAAESQAAVIFVDQNATGNQTGLSWADAFQKLQQALLVANPGDQIWVTMAAQYPTDDNNRDSTFSFRDGIDLYGGFVGNETAISQRDPMNHTILSGNIGLPNDSTDNSKHVCWVNDLNVEMILDGFIIEDGYAAASSGAAVYTHEGKITFENCILRNCYTLYGGAVCSTTSQLVWNNCRFENNLGVWGGAYQCWGGTTDRFYNCDFIGNRSLFQGGAVIVELATNTVFENCRFYGNSAPLGGAVIVTDDAEIRFMNALFDGNSADSGGAILAIDSCSFTLHNSLITQNNAMVDGGGIYLLDGEGRLYNTILYGNKVSGSMNNITGDTAAMTMDFCLLETPFPGMGNQVANPMFNDADGPDDISGNIDDDFHLHPLSPAINMGDTLELHKDLFDRDNDSDTLELFPFDLEISSRIYGTKIDIGPYESSTLIGLGAISDGGQIGYPYPNPANEFTTFDFTALGSGMTFILYNSAGKEVSRHANLGREHFLFFRKGLPGGLYYFTCIGSDGLKKAAGPILFR